MKNLTDRNGLRFSKIANTMNTYAMTTSNCTLRKWQAYARAAVVNDPKKEFTMIRIDLFDDARDAAYVSQEFEKLYDKYEILKMVENDTFDDVAKDFVKGLTFPEWKYPAEGYDYDTLLSIDKKVKDLPSPIEPRDAILTAMRVMGASKAPNLQKSKEAISFLQVEHAKGDKSMFAIAKEIVASW